MVELRGLSVAPAAGAKSAVLRDLDLKIAAGEQVAVIGASGSGKTTLLMALACALKPLHGTMSLFGRDPWALSSAERQALRARLVLAPQVPPLPPRQRVVTAVLAGRLPVTSLWTSVRNLWHPSALEASRAHAALAALDVGDKLWQRVDRLSGGERQRVGLSRVLVSAAALWLVDEPLSALDPARAARAMDVLMDSAAQSDCTLVCSLHQVDVARRFPRIVALRDGRCVYDGPASGLDDAMLRDLYGEAGLASAPGVADETPLTGEPVLPQTMCR